jgi:hypothetical protein
LIRELITSFCIILVLVLVFTVLFASADPPPVTMKEWATNSPKDFLATTVQEVAGTSLSAEYGPPYQTTEKSGSTQGFGPLSPEEWFGQHIPVSTLVDYVERPLSTIAGNPAAKALSEWKAASTAQHEAWEKAYVSALEAAPLSEGIYDVAPGEYGPLGTILTNQYSLARSGGLDAALLGQNEHSTPIWFTFNQTFPMLYFGDSGQGGSGPDCLQAKPVKINRNAPSQHIPKGYGCWYYNQAVSNEAPRYAGYLAGDKWGIDNEVGNFPGAWWLPLYTIWYQFEPGLSGKNADLWAMVMTGLFATIFLLTPWIPGLRSIPKWIPLHRLLWKDYYELLDRERAAGAGRRDAPVGPDRQVRGP